MRDALVAYVVAQRRLIDLLQVSGADAANVSAAMTAELDQLAAAMNVTGREPDPRFRSDPGA